MDSPGYVAILVGHALVAVVGLGALGATGYFSALARRVAEPFANEQLRRYFRPGPNLAALAVYAIPLLGAALLSTASTDEVAQAYPWIGLGCWVAIVGLATSRIWPCERALRRLLEAASDLEEFRRVARRAERAAAAASVLGVVALVVMIAQP